MKKTEILLALAALMLIAAVSCASEQKTAWNPKPIEKKYAPMGEPGKISRGRFTYIKKWVVEDTGTASGRHVISAELMGEPKTGVNSLTRPKIIIEREITENGVVKPLWVKMVWGFTFYGNTITIKYFPGSTKVLSMDMQEGWGANTMRPVFSAEKANVFVLSLEGVDKIQASHLVEKLNNRPRFMETNEFETEGFDDVLKQFPELWPSYAEVAKENGHTLNQVLVNQANGNGEAVPAWQKKALYGNQGQEEVKTIVEDPIPFHERYIFDIGYGVIDYTQSPEIIAALEAAGNRGRPVEHDDNWNRRYSHEIMNPIRQEPMALDKYEVESYIENVFVKYRWRRDSKECQIFRERCKKALIEENRALLKEYREEKRQAHIRIRYSLDKQTIWKTHPTWFKIKYFFLTHPYDPDIDN